MIGEPGAIFSNVTQAYKYRHLTLKRILTYETIWSYLFLIAFSINCFAQKSVTGVQTVEKNFGTNLSGNEAIKGIEHLFSERIHDSYFDTTSNTACYTPGDILISQQ